ncbi:carbohydrate-binding module family 20 domain-containing protein [Anaerocolumna xylanovorans]|uniref:Alpha-amylase n=1 Tax=Anaerocolumna xylanovorans DSM 12503 TaxID=1121345 RepID=A0A1M7XYW5_9FIRM|nr:carbohydrate-binding module family 20 domain-containing protein [Anaerocolumna xylanovorans]SHO44261.1 alpha-amylase [Anaerocolumna xylanovorans DSM 12503]
MKKRSKLFCSMLLLLTLLSQLLGFTPLNLAPADTAIIAAGAAASPAAVSSEYGLPGTTADGVILHAFDWSFNTIKNNLGAIAEAGYNTVQTSVVQPSKEDSASMWYMLYQPIDFSVGNQLGTEADFQSLCQEADKYGIKIIVDVVCNHTANNGSSQEMYPSDRVNAAIKNNANFWHTYKGSINYSDRWQVTHGCIGLPDLATENTDLQNNYIIPFLKKLVSDGADGFRFDAAKHIALPEDNDSPVDYFWPNVLAAIKSTDSNSYVYGEVLQSGDKDIYDGKYTDAFEDYAKYINLTASSFGYSIRNAVKNHNVGEALSTDYGGRGVDPGKLVTWVESHDTYLNSGGDSSSMSNWQIEMGWALVSARAKGTPLFFDRPTDGKGASGTIGKAGDNEWKDNEVVALNKFHNAMAGQSETLRQINSNVLIIDRGTKGSVILSLDGNTTFTSQATSLADGTYTDKTGINGTFTVQSGKLSGTIKSGTIAVLYNTGSSNPVITVSPDSTAFSSDTQTITMSYSNAASAAYSLNNGTPVSFSSGTSIQIGSGDAYGTSYTLTVTASNITGSTTKVCTYVKSAASGFTVHYYKPSSWGTPNIYYYDETVTPKKEGAAWPGTAMTSEGDGWYSYTISGWNKAYVIFNSGSVQIPASGQPGYLVTKNCWIKDGVMNDTKPSSSLIPVTFTVNNATTALGQNVYIAGNITELGNWAPANAAGPASCPNYPTWKLTVSLPAGKSIEFKAIKKDGSGNVVWQSGSNKTYTVPASGTGSVSISW